MDSEINNINVTPPTATPNPKTLGAIIRMLRAQRGWTQDQVIARSKPGLRNRSTLARMELGEFSIINMGAMSGLAQAFEVSRDDLERASCYLDLAITGQDFLTWIVAQQQAKH